MLGLSLVRMGVRCIIIVGEPSTPLTIRFSLFAFHFSSLNDSNFTYYPFTPYRAGTDTLVLEMTPTTRPSQMFWEEASMLHQVYANILLPPPSSSDGTTEGTDMYADVQAVIEILEEYLGRADPRGVAIGEAYRWGGEEVLEGLRGE